MPYTDVVTMINGHAAATVDGRRLVFTREQWRQIQKDKIDQAVELINVWGLKKSREILSDAPPGAECFSWALGGSGVYDRTVVLAELKDAIETLESSPAAYLSLVDE